ncbi:SMI1/KNR4 family protein [Ornithinibacillus massiliensis]|uniref:SMI1/KNR4 family protein n=1 Tax=Ornithinibacillus massiliensis TaxID=1944633 RepID=A0ABS5MFU7_9BACI|nr:SMI1/KNR4 family protein [Ornithinibacillus massiliensis]MBS3681169.1 SMI1/KNR4 family protein [Ornithinibacillus massiliensis]
MADIWANHVLDDYELDPLDDKTIDKVERKLGVTFPVSYINLLREKNGGELKCNRYPYVYEQDIDEENPEENADLTIDFLHGISTRKSEGVLESIYLIKEWELPKDIVILSSNGGEIFIAFDYRQTKTSPPIILIDAEMEFEDVIAANFDELLNKLYEDEDDGSNDLTELDKFYDSYTYEEAEKFFKTDKVGIIQEALEYFFRHDDDSTWLLTNMEQLVHSKKADFAPHVVAEVLYKFIESKYDTESSENKKLVRRVIEQLVKHSDPVIPKVC